MVSGPKQLKPLTGPAAFQQAQGVPGKAGFWLPRCLVGLVLGRTPFLREPELWDLPEGGGKLACAARRGWEKRTCLAGGNVPARTSLQQHVITQVYSFWWISGQGRQHIQFLCE